jgi:Domain of unknown function (DUF4440)
VSEELYRIEQQLASAIERSDVDAAGGLLADDFVLSSTGGVGDHVSRDEWLESLTKLETRSLSPQVLGARIIGDVAVVRLRVSWDATLGDRDLTGDYAVTDVFRDQDGNRLLSWRISVRLPDA